MKLEAYLERVGFGLDAVANAVREALDAPADEVIFVAGSVVDGLANLGSDLDVYVISERDLGARRVGPAIPVFCEGSVLDVEVWPPSTVDAALTAIERGETVDRAESVCIPPRTLSFLHRLYSGVPLQGTAELQRIRRSSSRRALARTLLRRALVQMDSYHRDLAGMLASEQWRTALVFTRELVGATADALLAALGNTNPSAKWRMELLRAASEDPRRPWVGALWEALFDLTLCRGYPATPSSSLVHDAVRLANRVAVWAELQLSSGVLEPSAGIALPPVQESAEDEEVLPRMSPNLRVRPTADGLRISSVLTQTELLVNRAMCELLLRFDGRTSRRAVIEALARATSADRTEIERRVHDTEVFLTAYGWFDDPQIARPNSGSGWV